MCKLNRADTGGGVICMKHATLSESSGNLVIKCSTDTGYLTANLIVMARHGWPPQLLPFPSLPCKSGLHVITLLTIKHPLPTDFSGEVDLGRGSSPERSPNRKLRLARPTSKKLLPFHFWRSLIEKSQIWVHFTLQVQNLIYMSTFIE